MEEMLDRQVLLKEGFEERDDGYHKDIPFPGGSFFLRLKVSLDGEIEEETIEEDTGLPYLLLGVAAAKGEFVEDVRRRHDLLLEKVLWDIGYPLSPFLKNGEEAIRHFEEKYGEKAEPPFQDGEALVLRTGPKGSWYALFLTGPAKYLKDGAEGEIPYLNVKCPEPFHTEIVARGEAVPAYHMNKRQWLSYSVKDTPSKVLIEAIERSRREVRKKERLDPQ